MRLSLSNTNVSGLLFVFVTLIFWRFAIVIDANPASPKKLIIDTDLFSDIDDAGALMLAATSPAVRLLAVNVNYPSSYSALAASAILSHYGHPNIPVGICRPLTDVTFFDSWYFELGEFASKLAYHWRSENGTVAVRWGHVDEDAWDPVKLYRKVLAEAEDGSVTIASIGFFVNLSGLLNSTADVFSPLTGPELVAAKVSELVIMGGDFPSGYEWNFWGDNPSHTAHVVNTWKDLTPIVYSGSDLGKHVLSGSKLVAGAPENDPVASGYLYYTYNKSARPSWDPLTVMYAMDGLGDLFEFANEFGYNWVDPDGSNEWVYDSSITTQHWLKLKVNNETAAAEVDRRFLEGAWSQSSSSVVGGNLKDL